ncbi:hypothetical protein L873DRAFT_1805676 [Choiromyces venosus 120613-1]|uniref:Protein transport protein sec16 n=1 Tax=Choiromyces venosus 120613-1 TaxID=1336337 RepID=A0A3N4K2T7_9PEZI|nr:hypothetical protein L873DRAFT_1805676 [Choiromyces venosus 120613-1]
MEEAQHPPTSPEITTSAPVPEAPSSLQTENGTMDSLSVSRVAGGGNSSSALPRNLSTASLSQTPEACHVEDIDQGCSHVESHHKNSVLHSAVPTPVASRSPSRIALHNMAENQGVLPQMKEGMGEGAGSTRGEPMEAEEEEKGLEMKVEPKVNLDSENNVPSNASSQVENPYIAHSPAPVDHPVPAEDPKPVIAESRPVYPAPETAPSEGSVDSEEDQPIENQQVPDPASEADINWGFDDIAALQSHVNGTDSFELLKQRAPERSSSFPQAGSEEQHQTPGSDDTEQALFNMMASEVATGNGDRGMFDTPSVEQGGLFDSNGVAGAEESFFDGFSGNGAGNPTVSMGQVTDNGITTAGPGLDAEENTEKEASRYEEGLPLINNDDEAKEDTDLFGDVKTDDDFFGGLSSGGPDTGDRGISGLQRKSTIQAIDGAKGSTHPYHSGEGAAASLSAVMSEVVESTNNTPPAKDPIASLFGGSEENSGQPDGEDFFGQIQQQEKPEQVPKQESADDLTAQWQAALAGDEFLADDSEGFLPSDDEGFLPDSDDETPVQRPVHGPDGTLQGFSNISTGNIPQAPSAASRYTPQAQIPTQPSVQPQYGGTWPAPQPQQAPYNPYAPPQQAFQAPASQMPGPPPAAPYSAFGGRPPPAPEMKAQSFVDKKEGYQSPYDLPLDIGPPAIRKRPSNLQQLQSAIPAGMGSMVSPPPPVRSSSMGAFFSAEAPTQAQQPQGPPKPKVIPQQKFFEELPIGPPKQRATSALGRHPESMNRAPSGAGGYQVPPPRPESTQGFYQSPKKTFAQPVMGSPQQMSAQLAPQTTTAASRYSPAPRATSGMYAAPPAPAASVRYSPAPSTTMGYQPPPATIHPPVPSAAPYASPVSAPPAGGMKYAPRPAGPPQVGNRVPSGGFATPPQQAPPPQQPFMSPPSMTPQNLPHQHSFTASPPFHHPHSPEDPHHSHPRRFSGEHHAMHSSRPGTARSVQVSAMDIPREEEEEGATNSPQMFQNNGYPSQSPQSGVPPPTQSRYAPSRGSGRDSPASLPSVTRQNTFTPPPPSTQSPRYIPNALPQRTISPETTFQPPPRAQTQSPGMAFGKANKITQRPRDPYERPSSAFAHSSSASYASIDFHQRQQSLGLNFMAPNDEAGQDVLQRWQGAPVFCWGFGGSIAYTFPKRAQRYTSDMQQPMIKCSPGEVKVRSIKEILPFEESEGKFPGPAWSGSKSANKAKKKELLTWFTDKIEDLERRAQGEGTRAEEKVLLWKIVRVLLENDGVLEGSPEVEKATRAILSPETVEEGMGDHGSFVVMGDMSSATQGPNIERADPQAVNTIKNNLLKGDRAAAVWHAVDRKLWSHALLISGTVCRDLWKQVVQEFVKNEVKTLGEGADSLAALYETFAGNWEECVDELVSASARMGMPMLGGASRSGSVNIDEKLDRWRETLGLILSNRSPGDAESIMALGKMLVGYGRVEAGHICYLFARQGALGSTGSVFSGHDDPAADFSLLGADHRQATFGRDADSVMLSEVYELAVSLCATPSPGFPHLQSYKLQCAIVLAENGQKGEAQKYCDSIASSIKAWNKPSPYFHPGFFGGLEDLSTRLSMSPKDSSPSGTGAAGKWIPKLSSDTVSNSLWGTFNKFVAGEEEETSSTTGGEGGMMDAVAGPFAKVAGPGNVSPDISRVQSGVDLYSAYNNAPSYNGTPPMAIKPASQAANRYAPSNSYQPKSSLYEPAVNQRATSDTYKPIGYGGGYEPSSNPYAPQQQTVNPYDSPVPSSISTGYPGASTYDSRSSFEDTSSTTKPETMETSVSEPPPSSGGYQPPSAGGYEPPSTEFTPYEPENNDDENEDDKPKPKKSFMDDDDDDFAKKAEQARKLQQEEAKKKAEEEKKNSGQDEGKKGWFGGWFGKKDPNQQGPIKAKLGEESSFVYDPDLKRWVNKKAGDTAAAPPKPAPPPKRASTPTSQPSSTPSTPGFPPSGTSSAPPTSGLHAPPPPFGRSPIPSSVPSTSTPPPPSGPPASAPPSAGPPGAGPPSRPPTSISQRAPTGDTIDDLLGPPGAPVSRKSTPGGGKKRGKSRYVEVIPGQS